MTKIVFLQQFLLFIGSLHDIDLTNIVSFHYDNETQNVTWPNLENL